MTTLNPYLVFKGNCEEAFLFYRSVFGGGFRFIGKYKDTPPSDKHLFPPDVDEKIMHVTLPISGETMLMGSLHPDHQFSLSVNTDTKNEADRIYNALSVDGIKKMPMTNTFWGSYFGMLTDKFGSHWMISFATNET